MGNARTTETHQVSVGVAHSISTQKPFQHRSSDFSPLECRSLFLILAPLMALKIVMVEISANYQGGVLEHDHMVVVHRYNEIPP